MNAKGAIVLPTVGFLALSSFVMLAAKAQSGVGGTPPTTQAATNSTGPKKAEEQFKNIQVLKGVPADEIFPTMQFITASLGVELSLIHI